MHNSAKSREIHATPWILYDGSCEICTREAARLGAVAARRGFVLATLQSPVGRALDTLGTDEMKVVTHQGSVLGGAEAIVYVARHVWWAWPLAFLWRFAHCRSVLRRLYRWIADHRHCLDGVCRRDNGSRATRGERLREENPYTLEL